MTLATHSCRAQLYRKDGTVVGVSAPELQGAGGSGGGGGGLVSGDQIGEISGQFATVTRSSSVAYKYT